MRREDGSRPPSAKRASRQLSLRLRVRSTFRHEVDRLLDADVVWSAVLVAVVVLLVGGPWVGLDIEDLEPGQLAPRDIKALESFDYPDEMETGKRQREAREAVPEIYTYYPDTGSSMAGQLAALFQRGRVALEAASLAGEDPGPRVAEALHERIPEASLEALLERRFDPALERELTNAVKDVMGAKIVTNRAALERNAAIDLGPRDGELERVARFEAFLELEEARTRLRGELTDRLEGTPESARALAVLASSFLNTNVNFDRGRTDDEQARAALAVQPVYRKIERGELVLRKNERLTAEHLAKLSAAREASGRPQGPRQWLSLLFLAMMLAFFLYRYCSYHQRAYRKLTHLHALLVLTVVSFLFLGEVILWLARRLTDNLGPPFSQIDVYPYVIPLGAGAILVALLTNGRIATVYAAFAALLFGASMQWNAYLMLWAMLVQCAGVYAISTYRDRAALLRAGLVVGGAGAVAALSIEALRGESVLSSEGLYAAGLAFAGGAIGVGLLISFSLPILEKLFGVLTDIRLLELSNVNNPLLSELAMRAPGSYNHSLVVGTLAEEGARAIGANSLFCRVAAFYHDIGKMNKPEYFVENQRGSNPHDRLSPSMSALIIASHVKDGVKMAREARLPEQLVDIIPQHHGTKLMTYFYEKARKGAEAGASPVAEADFRYPGPKPQTREAALFMLADAVEAAARTVDEPTSHRLQEMVHKITDSIVVSGELNECELTFSDLRKIQEAFLRILISMYHRRIDYPGFDFRQGGEQDKPPVRLQDHAGESKTAEFRDRRRARGS